MFSLLVDDENKIFIEYIIIENEEECSRCHFTSKIKGRYSLYVYEFHYSSKCSSKCDYEADISPCKKRYLLCGQCDELFKKRWEKKEQLFFTFYTQEYNENKRIFLKRIENKQKRMMAKFVNNYSLDQIKSFNKDY